MFEDFFTSYIDAKIIKRPEHRRICLLRDDNGNISSDYGFNYETLSFILSTGNYSKYIKNGDFIEVTTSDGYIHQLFANIDTYYGCGDKNKKIGHHIDFISRNLIPGSKGWQMRIFSDSTNNGNENEKSPILSSCTKYGNESGIIDKLEDYYKRLPKLLKNHIVNKYHRVPYRYSSKGMIEYDNGYGWKDMGRLWIPYEKEVFGINKHAENKYEDIMKQYHSFKYVTLFGIKYDYKWSTTRPVYWWTSSAEKGLAGNFCYVSDKGLSRCCYASYSNNGIPLCFRFM